MRSFSHISPSAANQSEEAPGRPFLFQGPASQPELSEVPPCAGRCPKSERVQIFMPQGSMHQWRPQADEVCCFRSRSLSGVYPRDEGRGGPFDPEGTWAWKIAVGKMVGRPLEDQKGTLELSE
ncbi:uncharacterized protein CTRU02_212848 [Colletotrichum truncatum]|uniref:Uncharacterized protein n=1 Tax=Colletotrichum truncatum TaxID=5467 RepID=A0ACC3YJ11_COLTU|nr:uncharacterized protein CTRU02_03174 [Colletotrichum truncatum]KAF6797143.1 hypothetical protein CTRU02_03174 [Colletotrichum truncatum]